MTWTNVISDILKINDKIYFVTIYDIIGNISETSHHNSTKNILSLDKSITLLKLAVKSWQQNDIFSTKLGSESYMLAVYEKTKQIMIRFGKGHVVYMMMDIDYDHEKIINNILKLGKNISKKS